MLYSINENESHRITCLRGLCVLLVLFLHQYAGEVDGAAFAASGTVPQNEALRGVQYFLSRIVSGAATPLFFLLSAVLLYRREFTWKENLRKKGGSLILPYVLWITLYILVYLLGQSLPVTRGFFLNEGRRVRTMGFADFVGAYTGVGGHGLFVNALWFLRDLILLQPLAPLLKKLIDRFPALCLILLALLWNLGRIPGSFVLHKQSVVFFGLGYYVVKYGCRMKQLDALPAAGIAAPYALAVLAEFYFYRTGNPLRIAAHSFSAALGMLGLVRLSGLLCRDGRAEGPRWLRTVARYSFFVYASQDLVQTILKKLAAHALPQTDFVRMAEYFVLPLLTCGVCVGAAALLRAIAPRAYTLFAGGRSEKTA